MAEKYTCGICGKTITPSNSPSFFDWRGKPYSTVFPVCDKCAEKSGASKWSSDKPRR